MMKNPPHPGLSVRHDCLEPLGLSVTDAARKLGVSRKQLSEVVNARSGISPEMAIRLDRAFGGGANTWLRMQAAYDLAQAMKKADRIRVERITGEPAPPEPNPGTSEAPAWNWSERWADRGRQSGISCAQEPREECP